MKWSLRLLVVCLAFLVGVLAAQISSPSLGIAGASAATSCTAVTGASVTLCPVPNDGLYLAVGSGAFSKVATGSTSAGVTSFNGRTGAVVSANGDYSYSQLSGTPIQKPSFTCPTISINNSGMSAGPGCN